MKEILDRIEDQFMEPLNDVLFHIRFDTKVPLTQVHLKPTRKLKDPITEAFRKRIIQLETPPIHIPVWAMCLFFYEEKLYLNEAKRVSRRTPSLIRLLDIAVSSLVKANVIHSHKLVQSHDGSRKLIGESNYVEIFLMPYDVERNTKKFRGGEFQ